MADYYSLIVHAAGGLTPSTRQARREIYDRELAKVMEQLRSTQPALSRFDITRERLEFEAAARRFEDQQKADQLEEARADGAEAVARASQQELVRRPDAESKQPQAAPSRVRLTPEEAELVRRIQEKLDLDRRQEGKP